MAINNSLEIYLETIQLYPLSEYKILHEDIKIEKLSKVTLDKMNIIKKELNKYNVNIKDLESFGKNLYNKIKKSYDTNADPKLVGKIFQNEIKNKVHSLIKKITENHDLTKSMKLGIIGFMAIFIINSFISIPIMGMLGSVMGMRVICVFVAPIVEESLKTYFIKKKIPYIGTGVTFGIEFLMYAIPLIMGGMGVASVLIIRSSVLLMHFFTTFLQKNLRDKSTENVNKQRNFFAWLVSVLFHGLWNFTALAI